jgi:SHS2 domain-containing protein
MAQMDWLPFEEAPHTADLALIARGRDLRELILNACNGAISLVVDVADLAPSRWVAIAARGPDPERILLGMVKQVLYRWEVERGLPVCVQVTSAPDAAWTVSPDSPAEARGRLGLADPEDLEDRVKAVPKAATYHDLAIRRAGELLEVTIILDL